jgi:hypothetical protein
LGAGAYIAISLWSGQSIISGAGGFVLPFLAIQIGYFLGLVGRDRLATVLSRVRPGPAKRI